MKLYRILLVLMLFNLLVAGVWGFIGMGTATAESIPTQTIPFPDQRTAVQQAITWLVSQHQNDDGGYSSFSSGANLAPSDVGGTVDAMLPIAAAGYDPASPAPDQENTPLTYLQQNPEAVAVYAATDGSTAGKLVMALVAANQNPRDFIGHDFVISLTQHLSPTGQLGVTTAFGQSLAILGLRSAGADVPPQAISWLTSLQAGAGELAGSWDDGFGTAGNVDATATAVMALLAAGVSPDDEPVVAAAGFLARAQLPTGGWEYGAGFGENGNSTALAVQALQTLEQDISQPVTALLAWQNGNGAFQADFGNGRLDDFYTTVQAIPAVLGKVYPLPGRADAVHRAVGCLAALQDPASGGWEEFPGFGVNAPGTARAIQALVAAGVDVNAPVWAVNGSTPLQVLEGLTPEYLATSRGGGLGTIILAVVAAAAPEQMHNFAGQDLELTMSGYLSPTGEYDHTAFGIYAHARAVLGLLVSEHQPDETAVQFLINAQLEEGDWGYADMNGVVLQVLGRLGVAVPGAFDRLHFMQLPDGGWGFDASSPSSSAEVAQGLVVYGENPFSPVWSQVVAGRVTSAADWVMAQQAENGCWANLYGPGDDIFSTVDAVLLLTLPAPWPMVFTLVEPAVETSTPVNTTAEPILAATAVPTDPPTVAATAVPPTDVPATPMMTATFAIETADSPPASSTSPILRYGLLAVLAAGAVLVGVWYRWGRKV